MPKLKKSMFGGTDDETEPLLAGASGAAAPKAEALRQKTEAAKKKAEQAQQEMADEAKQAMDQAGGAAKQMAAQALAATTSLAAAVGCSYAPLTPLMSQIAAGVVAAVV